MKGIEADPAASGLRTDLAGVAAQLSRPPEKRKGSVRSVFMGLLESTLPPEASVADEGEALYRRLEGVMDQIHMMGEELARHPAPDTIAKYRQLVRSLIQAYVEKGLRTERRVSNRNILQQKSYQVIKVVDEKLEKLVVGILQSQYNQIEILGRVEEIQGLLVNLLH